MAEFMNEGGERAIREAFTRTTETRASTGPALLKAGWLETPVGGLLAAGDDDALYLLAYVDQSTMARKAAILQARLNTGIEMGEAASIASIRREITEYFAGNLREFATPLHLIGTDFQKSVWAELARIPFGQTIAYAELARRIGKPSSFRAVAQANAQNPVAIAVPCHRVVNTDGGLGGYSAGVERKTWLLEFERKTLETS